MDDLVEVGPPIRPPYISFCVPTEDGRRCMIDFQERSPKVWSLDIAEELIRQAPQAIAAAVTMALLQLRAHLDGLESP